MSYSVKEIYYTLQGEGAQTGRPAVFLRFAGCNLWSGREQHRAEAICRFCDTEFVGTDGSGGGKFETAAALAAAVAVAWPADGSPYVVCTGGEPLLQLDAPAIDALHEAGFKQVYTQVEGFEGIKAKEGEHKGKRLVAGWKFEGLPWSYDLPAAKMYFNFDPKELAKKAAGEPTPESSE